MRPLATTTPIQTGIESTATGQQHLQSTIYGTKQAIKWMHAVCGYLVKSTWLKAIKAGNYIGWPMLTERTAQNTKKHGACQQPTNSGDWQMALEGASKTPPILLSSSPNTRYRQTAEKTSHTVNFYAWSDPKRQNPTKCDSR